MNGVLSCEGSLSGTLSSQGTLTGALSSQGTLNGSLYIDSRDFQPYTGSYEFTPTENTQVVNIANKTATENIIINPIPSNYGRITWNGSVIRVS